MGNAKIVNYTPLEVKTVFNAFHLSVPNHKSSKRMEPAITVCYIRDHQLTKRHAYQTLAQGLKERK